MTLKFASALIAFMLAVSPAFAQIAERTPPGSTGERQVPEDADDNEPIHPPQTYLAPPLPVYTPAWLERYWVNAGYVNGYVQPVHLPALVTTSPPGTPQAQAGVLGPNTNVLFGDRDVNGDLRAGFRFGFGCWFDDDRILGFNAGFFWLTGVDQSYSASSNGSTILARPFIDANNGAAASQLIAFPASSGPSGSSSAGSVNVSANSGQFYGTHFDFQESILNDPGFRLKSLLGYRFLYFSDSLQISQTMDPTGGSPAPPPGTQIYSQDSFSASNTFNGGEVGFQAEWISGPFAASLLAKAAVGSLHRDININGSTLVTAPGNAPISTSGGLLAQSTNSGTFESNVFTVVPEVGLNLSYDLTANVRLSLGYDLLVLFHAVRAADQVDTTVNPSLLNPSLTTQGSAGTAQRPFFSLQQTNIWVQTINVGLELRY